MKKVYQLIIINEDGSEHDVFFSTIKKAERSLKYYYKIGQPYCNSIIENSFVMTRILF